MLQYLNATTANDVALELGKMLAEDPKRHAEVKIQLLSHLFNMLGRQSPVRPRIFSMLLRSAYDSQNSHMLVGRLDPVERWASLWNLSDHERADLYLWASKVSGQAGSRPDEQRFRIQFLKSFDDPSVPLTKDASDEAAAACLSAVRFSDKCDHLLELRAVQAISQTSSKNKAVSSHVDLVRLLEIVAVRSVRDFVAWEREFPASLGTHGIDRDELLSKLQILTLCSLGRKHELLTYDSLRAELQLDSDLEVERCVVASVRSGLLEARMDQLSRTATVSYTIQREFTKDSWRELKPQLSTWKENIRNVLVLLRHAGRQAMEIQN